MTSNDPHRRIDFRSSQSAFPVVGYRGCGGRVGKGGGVDLMKVGGTLPNNRKGRLNNNKRRARINCVTKTKTTIRNLSTVPSRAKKPRLSPEGNRLTMIARMRRKNKLYIAHCLVRFLEDTGMRKRFQ